MTNPSPAADDDAPKPRRRWVRWAVAVTLVVLAAAAGVGAVLWRRANAVPDFYARAPLTGEDRLEAIASVERKLGDFQGSFGQAVARQRSAAGEAAGEDEEVVPAEPEPATLAFTADELDTYFTKWLDDNGYREGFARHLADPRLAVHDGNLVVAGTMPAFRDAVVSLHLLPSVNDAGRVRLELAGAYAGRLPLPAAAFDIFRDKSAAALRARLPVLKADAANDPDAGLNDAAVSLAVNAELLALIEDKRLDDLVLFPRLLDFGRIPARVATMEVVGEELELGFLPLTPDERQSLIDDVLAAQPDPTVD